MVLRRRARPSDISGPPQIIIASSSKHPETQTNERNRSLSAASNILSLILILTPISLLLLLIFVVSHSITHSPSPQRNNVQASEPPTLFGLLSLITTELTALNVQHWLQPGLGLFPPTSASTIGSLNPWQSGVDISVFRTDLLHILHAQANLQPLGIVAIESYFGLRVFHIRGKADDRYDFTVPFVDIVYYHRQNNSVFSTCCNCDRVTISACTKKLCNCIACEYEQSQIFPLVKVKIDRLSHSVFAPRNTSLLLLPQNLQHIHPAVYKPPN